MISARAEDGKSATGLCRRVRFADVAMLGDAPVSGAPQIMDFYIDPSDLTGGDNVSPTFTVCARIKPSARGLSTGFSTVHTASALILDGKKSFPDALQRLGYAEDGTALISYRMGPLSPGLHKLCLRAVDNLGAVSEQALSFVVNASPTLGNLTIAGEGKACRSEAVFDLVNAGRSKGHLLVTDLYGRTVLSLRDCQFPFVWNLTDADERRVPDGHYSAWAIIDGEDVRSSTPRLAFTVIE